VKKLRVWLMVLLMLLLPARGALAAAMLCLPQEGNQNAMVHHAGAESGANDHASHGHGPHAHADDAQSGDDGDLASPGSDDCNLCAGFCSLTPIASAVPDLHHPSAQAALTPATSAPAPSFVLDGEERPPRTL
jgi:hypothetical protein